MTPNQTRRRRKRLQRKHVNTDVYTKCENVYKSTVKRVQAAFNKKDETK